MGNRKVNIPMCLAFVLFVLTLISMHMTSGLYARYTATATGSDSARVAKFEVLTSVATSDITVNCTSSDSGAFQVTVTNNSEVSVAYRIDVGFTQQISGTDLLVTMNGSGGSWSADRKTVTFSGFEELGPKAAPVTHTLQFEIANWTYVTGQVQGSPTASLPLDFQVNVRAEQID